MKSILPLILIVLALTGAITYSLSKRALPQKPINSLGIPANQLENGDLTPTPTTNTKVTFGSLTAEPTPTPTIIATPTVSVPEVTEAEAVKTENTQIVSSTITKTQICTPVYGAADTCTEHIVVDTGAENALFFNFAGLAYISGLASFVFAKRA